ncbi:MAG: hypothetical protein R2748_32770 [Bryobacterales bacterium]
MPADAARLLAAAAAAAGQQRCGSCGSAGRMQRYVTKTVWDSYANRLPQHSETVMENCNMCGSSGRAPVRAVLRTGQAKLLPAAPTAAKSPAAAAAALGQSLVPPAGHPAGPTDLQARLQRAVALRVEARHAQPEVVGRLKTFSLEQLASIGTLEQRPPEVRENALRRRYAFSCRITEMVLDTEGTAIRLDGFGDRCPTCSTSRTLSACSKRDLQTLETTVQQAPTFGVGPDENTVDAIRQCLESEANQQLGEGGAAAEKLKSTGTLSQDYAARLTTALRAGFRKLYLGEIGLGAAIAATLPAVALSAIALAGWRATSLRPFVIAMLASVLLYVGAEVFARSRVNRLFHAHMESKRMRSLLRGLGVLKQVRLTTAIVSLVLLLAALRLATWRM